MNKKVLLVKIIKIAFLQLSIILSIASNAIAYEGSAQRVLHTKMTINKPPVAEADQPVFITVSGKVTDEKGETLTGVSVRIKGTSVGVTTDNNGRYKINVPDGSAVLIFGFIGFQPQENKVGDLTVIDIKLLPGDKSLDEVVVVGYGVQKKVDLTGSVATVSGEALNKEVATSPLTLLQGKAPGLNVFTASGEPGNNGTTLRIRGLGTYSGAGVDPLVVVDGIPLQGVSNLDQFDPNDIESISVLKDAASASIYGTRAANGVILVITKKGVSGKFNLEYDYNAGITSPDRLLPLITNSVEYMTMYNEAIAHDGAGTPYPADFIARYAPGGDLANVNVDWQKLVFSTKLVSNHYLNATGGSNGTRYSVALGLVDEPGVFIGFSNKKYTLKVGLNSTINKVISFGVNLNLNYDDTRGSRQGSTDAYLSTITQPPIFGPYVLDGSGNFTDTNHSDPTGSFHNKNPLAVAKYLIDPNLQYNAIANMFLDVKVLPGLVWETRGGLNFAYSIYNDTQPTVNQYNYYTGALGNILDVGGGSGVSVSMNQSVNPVIYSQLTWNKQFSDNAITLLGGGQEEYSRADYLYGYRNGYLTTGIRQIDAGANNTQQYTSGNENESALQSLYGRFNYNYKEKYLLEGNVRYDGSSRFAPGHRFGTFPSFSAGWRATQESFIKNLNWNWLSELKLRGSWGLLGNQDIGNYPYEAVFNSGLSYPIDNSGNLANGVSNPNLYNTSISWETTRTIDFGLDANFIKNKINFTADWYTKTTYGILQSAVISDYKGLGAPTVNLGSLNNKGGEVSVGYHDKKGDFSYGVTLGLETNANKLINFGETQIGGTTINQNGHEDNEFYLYKFIGIFQSQAEINSSPYQGPGEKPGDLKFADISGPNGKPDGKIDSYDRTYFKGAYPNYDYSASFNFGYKRFDLSIFTYGVEGQKDYVAGFGFEPFAQNAPPLTLYRNAWTPQNHSNTIPALYIQGAYQPDNYPSSYFLKDASFLRIKNVVLGYDVPAEICKKIGMSNLRLYVAGDNLAVFTKFPAGDPERGTPTGNGAELAQYPQNKVVEIGAKVKF